MDEDIEDIEDYEDEDDGRKKSKRRSLKQRRSFTITGVTNSKGIAKGKKNLGGRFISTNPASAAKKAGTQICRDTKVKGKCALIITVQETTQNSHKKEYTYKYSRIHDPVTVVRKGVEITFNYKTECKALK